MFEIIRTLVDLYIDAKNPKRISTPAQKRKKINQLQKKTNALLQEIKDDPILSIFPDASVRKNSCHLEQILEDFYDETPVLIDRVIPWVDLSEPIAITPHRYLGMMLVQDWNIQDSAFLAEIINTMFDNANYDTSSARKIINKVKKV